MMILGIESSCDDTSAAVIKDDKTLLSNVISSQVEFHTKYGGVVPEIASRKHQECIIPVIKEALFKAGVTLDDINGIAVTQGPGLVGSLLVGINAAKSIAHSRKLPIVGINHLEGHMLAPHLENDVSFPNITLVVSGGHTNLYKVGDFGDYTLLGSTRDDAAGEAFDKVAKLLDLGYPGGVVIDRLSKLGDPSSINFPRPMLNDPSYDFSFSGLKTAVRYYIDKIPENELTDTKINNICASFQTAVVDILTAKTIQAAREHHAEIITLTGGVAANSLLRSQMTEKADLEDIRVFTPSILLCTDNAAMIAFAGLKRIRDYDKFPYSLNAISRWPL
jgi:N6-L-threonylcarbamoyladenine synthase